MTYLKYRHLPQLIRCWRLLGLYFIGFDIKSITFFFSSRRRHTRLQGDWSSDVCSSDLGYSLAKRSNMVRGDAKDKRKEERNNEAEQPKWFSGLRVLWVIGAVTRSEE